MSNTEGSPYSYTEKRSLTRTSGGAEKTQKGIVDSIGDAINKMHIKKLSFVVLIFGYCVIAFSKGEKGVLPKDLLNYVLFVIFSLAIYGALYFFEDQYCNKDGLKK